jgi:hypothetical protein
MLGRLSWFRVFRIPLAVLVTATVSRAAETRSEAAVSAPAETTVLIADLRTPLARGFCRGSWEGRVGTTKSGLVVQGGRGADGSGELGQDFEAPRDLSKVKFVELALGVGARNEVPEVTIAFDDASDTQYTARVRIDQVLPEQPVWFRVRLADFKLNNWQGNKASAAIDWTRIARWHLQGDWSKAVPLHVVFIALRCRP